METGLVLPAGAFLFTLALVGWLLRRRERKIRTVRPVFPRWGVKLTGISKRLLALGRDRLVWFDAWEELTELVTIFGLAAVLWVFRQSLFARRPAGRPGPGQA
jgi:hypothetical protein